MFRRENGLQTALVMALRASGLRAIEEFPLLGSVADVFAIAPSGETAAYECKMSDWRRAISQARRHLPVCDRVYVVMPRRPYAVMPASSFVEGGVGLILVDEAGPSIVVPANSTTGYLIPELHARAVKQFGTRVATFSLVHS